LLPTALTFFAETIEQLKLYVKQFAWLNTIPEKQKRPRRETSSADLPPLHAGAHLVSILFDIGPAKPMPMSSPVAIDEQDILAWQINRDLRLSPFEAATVRELSREYASALIDAASPSCPPFYFSPEAITEERRRKVSEGMREFAAKLNASRNV
jgi:hypothetical protein